MKRKERSRNEGQRKREERKRKEGNRRKGEVGKEYKRTTQMQWKGIIAKMGKWEERENEEKQEEAKGLEGVGRGRKIKRNIGM